jgi:hypothetical protein
MGSLKTYTVFESVCDVMCVWLRIPKADVNEGRSVRSGNNRVRKTTLSQTGQVPEALSSSVDSCCYLTKLGPR